MAFLDAADVFNEALNEIAFAFASLAISCSLANFSRLSSSKFVADNSANTNFAFLESADLFSEDLNALAFATAVSASCRSSSILLLKFAWLCSSIFFPEISARANFSPRDSAEV